MGSVRPPWATLDDNTLGVCAYSNSSDAVQKEKYLLQAPWTKRGNDRDEETSNIRQALDVRQQRRAENAQREKALRGLSKDDNEESLRRAQEFRAARKEQKDSDAMESHEERVRDLTQAAVKQRGLTAQKRADEAEDRRRAHLEAQKNVERKRALLARDKAAIKSERQRSINLGQDHASHVSELQGARRQESVAYKKTLSEESAAKRRVRAEKIREERLAKEKEKRIMMTAQREKKQVRACWMVEEKEEMHNRKEELIRERAESIAQRSRSMQIERKEQELGQNRVAAEFKAHNERSSAVKAADRKLVREEARHKRDLVNQQMETRHLRAVERKRLERLAFKERNVAPLERRAELARQRAEEQKKNQDQYHASLAKDAKERQMRRVEIIAREKEEHKKPLLLG